MKPSDTETRGLGETGNKPSSPRLRVSASPRQILSAIKIIAALLLLLSFFLPMSSCSYNVPLEWGVDGSPADAGTVTTETRTTIMYAREYIEPGEIGAWLNLLAFTWAFPLLGLQWRFTPGRYSWLFSGSGVLLAVFSAAVIYAWADIGRPLIGAYVGGVAAVALFVLYLIELGQVLKKRNENAARSIREKPETGF